MLKYFISSLLAALLIVVAFVNTPSAHAQVSPGAQSLIIPINRAVFVPCANNGQGEVVAFSGNEHLTSNFIITGGGVLFNHIVLQANFQGVTGVGQTTGDKYQGVEVEKQTFNRPGVGGEEDDLVTFQMIGQGPGNNFLLHILSQATVNANGILTAFFANISVECK